jgi:hypothetical protein
MAAAGGLGGAAAAPLLIHLLRRVARVDAGVPDGHGRGADLILGWDLGAASAPPPDCARTARRRALPGAATRRPTPTTSGCGGRSWRTARRARRRQARRRRARRRARPRDTAGIASAAAASAAACLAAACAAASPAASCSDNVKCGGGKRGSKRGVKGEATRYAAGSSAESKRGGGKLGGG